MNQGLYSYNINFLPIKIHILLLLLFYIKYLENEKAF